jgi:hypothetical protein
MVKKTKRTIVYIDGFNLFYRALKAKKNVEAHLKLTTCAR